MSYLMMGKLFLIGGNCHHNPSLEKQAGATDFVKTYKASKLVRSTSTE